jgi:hypothetical protein
MDLIAINIKFALQENGYPGAEIKTVRFTCVDHRLDE